MNINNRRPVKLSHMGKARRKVDIVQTRSRILEWTKALIMSLAIATSFLIFAWRKGSSLPKFLRKSQKRLNNCDLRTYPLENIDKLTELNLSGCGYTSLPADSELWSRFSSVTKIDLNNNSLIELPSEMKVLSSLEILFLSENKIKSVPNVISELNKLRLLSLRGNLITILSSANMPTSSLVWLILTNNQISMIDPNVSELKHLRKLMLSHNMIDKIPVELGECKELELVRFADNDIKSIPKEILTLPKLAWISLSGNPMSITPKNIGKEMNENEIQMTSTVLGQGASGTVYRAKYRGEDVAVKIFKEGGKGSDGNAADEAGINAIIDHPLAISAIGIIKDGQGETYKGMVMKLLSEAFPVGKPPNFTTGELVWDAFTFCRFYSFYSHSNV